MTYDFTKASELARWCEEQLGKKTKYQLGGIGRYKDGVRIFDCIGLIKCFLWRDYSQNNAKYYGKTAPDTHCEGYLDLAKEKGPIATIPEIPGVIVYQRGHVGVYMGNGLVIEATAAWDAKVQKSYFKGSHKGIKKRTTWTHWFKVPQLTYEEPEKEETSPAAPVKPSVPQEPAAGETVEELAKDVLDGKYGNGKARVNALGDKYAAVQAKVNEILRAARENAAKVETIKVGDTVKVVKPVQFDNGKPFAVYYNEYKALEVAGDRICIGVGGKITAAVHRKNLKKA